MRAILVALLAAFFLVSCGRSSSEHPLNSNQTPSSDPVCDSRRLISIQTSALPRRITEFQPQSAKLGEKVQVSIVGFDAGARVEVVAGPPGSDVRSASLAAATVDAQGAATMTFEIAPDADWLRRGLVGSELEPCMAVVVRPADTEGVYVGPRGEPRYAIAYLAVVR